MIEVDEGVGWPEAVAELFAGDDLAGFLEEQGKDLEGLVLELDSDAVLAEFAGAEVELEAREAQPGE